MVLTLVLIIAAAMLLPSHPYLDFQVLYHADLGLLRGISVYDHAGQVDMIAGMANVRPDQVFVLPFPYPPWYALSTLWLAMLGISLAARVWFALSLGMLVLSVWMLTAGERPPRRMLFFLGALLWLPVLGSLFVGQYGFPTLLGAALMIHALRRGKTALAALAAVLLTFKPHLGGLVLILAMLDLVQRRNRFGRNALAAILAAGAVLFIVGFLASPGWPVAYARSLSAFQAVDGVSRCTQCVSLPVMLARLAGGGLGLAAWISLVLAVACAGWLIWRWRGVCAEPGSLVAAGILVTLIVSPYLVNYDYMLLVIPFIVLARGPRAILERFGLALAYILPLVSLTMWRAAGNASLIVSAMILFAIAARQLSRGGTDAAAGPQLDYSEAPS